MKEKMWKIYFILCLVALSLIVLAGCSLPVAERTSSTAEQTEPAAEQPYAATPEVFAAGLGGGYGLAFDAKNSLYATGKDRGYSVVWKITGQDKKEVFATLDYKDPIAKLFGLSSGKETETNIAVDSAGNVWMTGSMNGQCYVAAKDTDARVVYLNKELAVSADVAEKDTKGVVWDEKSGKIYLVASGSVPGKTYSKDIVCHLVSLTPTADGFAAELNTNRNGWSPAPLYIKNDGTLLEQPGVALAKAKNSPLYLIGNDRLYILSEDGKSSAFGRAFNGFQLYGGTADESGNVYTSANSKTDPDNGKGAIYKIDRTGKASLLLENIGKPLGLAWNSGYLYIMDGAGDRVLRLNTGR